MGLYEDKKCKKRSKALVYPMARGREVFIGKLRKAYHICCVAAAAVQRSLNPNTLFVTWCIFFIERERKRERERAREGGVIAIHKIPNAIDTDAVQ